MTQHSKKRMHILITPLHWGMGHATRCVPLIRTFLNQGHTVTIACAQRLKPLFQNTFPHCKVIDSPDVEFRYSTNSFGACLNKFALASKMNRLIRAEHKWIVEVVKDFNIDLIISDNRYGCFHPNIPSILITHQINPISGWGDLIDRFFHRKIHGWINNFSECWIPDGEHFKLSGKLSGITEKIKIPIHRIGWLSRLEPTVGEDKHILVLLSGPEPTRTQLEEKVIGSLPASHHVIVVRGVGSDQLNIKNIEGLTSYNNADEQLLSKLMQEARLIIARSGYSSVMDILNFQKKSVLIPTPHQTEQIYLAHYLQENKIAPSMETYSFTFDRAMQLVQEFDYQLPRYKYHEEVVISSIAKFASTKG